MTGTSLPHVPHKSAKTNKSPHPCPKPHTSLSFFSSPDPRTPTPRTLFYLFSPSLPVMGSGKGWTATESVAACRAYIVTSEGPVAGSGQEKVLFHKQILPQYKIIMEDAQQRNPDTDNVARTGDAIAQRFHKARCECLKFEAIILSIKAKQPTRSLSEKTFNVQLRPFTTATRQSLTCTPIFAMKV